MEATVQKVVRHNLGIKALYRRFLVERSNYFTIDLDHLEPNGFPRTSRIQSLLRLLKKLKEKESLPNKKIRVYLGDRAPLTRNTLSYCTRSGKYEHLIPDFLFDGLDYASITNYEEYGHLLTQLGSEEAETNKIGWSGNLFCHKNRMKLLQLAKENTEVLHVTHYSEHQVPEHMHIENVFVPISEVVKRNKYLIDIEGVGYSSRVKLLLHCNRPLFLQERPWEEFYSRLLQPYVHYIPVNRDLSNLVEQYEWAESNPGECAVIAKNALDFSLKNLTVEAALDQLHEAIKKV